MDVDEGEVAVTPVGNEIFCAGPSMLVGRGCLRSACNRVCAAVGEVLD